MSLVAGPRVHPCSQVKPEGSCLGFHLKHFVKASEVPCLQLGSRWELTEVLPVMEKDV